MERSGVSPVIGTILLIAITVALAAVVATLVGGLGGAGVPPNVILSITAKVNENDNNVIDITIMHYGGADMMVKEFDIVATTSGGKMQFPFPGKGRFTVGDDPLTTSYRYGAEAYDKAIEVSVIWKPTGEPIYQGGVKV